MKDSTILMPTVLRARITTASYYIGFIPGIVSTVIGAMLAGIGIYKRQTANLLRSWRAKAPYRVPIYREIPPGGLKEM